LCIRTAAPVALTSAVADEEKKQEELEPPRPPV